MKAKSRILRIKVAAAAAGMLGLMLGAPMAAAADSISVTVNATVLGVCKFSTGQTPTVNITNTGGGINPSLGTNATGTANINYKCTKGATPTASLPGGATATLNCTVGACSGESMNATISLTPASLPAGLGFGAADQVLTVTGTILPAQYGTVSAGDFTNTVTVDITP